MRGMGAPPEAIERAREKWEAQQEERPPIEVYPEHIPAFQILQATADQWEMPTAFGGRVALPLTEIEAAMRLLCMEITPTLSLRVITMVRAARQVRQAQVEAAMSKR
jgi:hypothetical protein